MEDKLGECSRMVEFTWLFSPGAAYRFSWELSFCISR